MVAAVLLLAAYAVLFFGGVSAGIVLEPWLTRKPPEVAWPYALLAFPLGLVGGAMLRFGISLLWREHAPPPLLSTRKVVAYGVLFPGAAQTNGRRWLLTAIFLGLDRFTLQGGPKVNIQWRLFALVHNIHKIRRYGWAGAMA